MYLIIYNTMTGEIVGATETDIREDGLGYRQTVETFTQDFPQEIKNNLNGLYSEHMMSPTYEFKVINNQIVKRDIDEINEIKLYRRILTPEDRLINQLKPSYEEIQKAENTIEILTLLQEVL